MSKGNKYRESAKQVKKEIDFMQKHGAPKAMVKHEKRELQHVKKGGPK